MAIALYIALAMAMAHGELPRPHAGISLYSPPLVKVQTQCHRRSAVRFLQHGASGYFDVFGWLQSFTILPS